MYDLFHHFREKAGQLPKSYTSVQNDGTLSCLGVVRANYLLVTHALYIVHVPDVVNFGVAIGAVRNTMNLACVHTVQQTDCMLCTSTGALSLQHILAAPVRLYTRAV